MVGGDVECGGMVHGWRGIGGGSGDSQTSGKLNDRQPGPAKKFAKSICAKGAGRGVKDKRIYIL